MKNIKQLKRDISIQQIRTFFFVVAIILYLSSQFLHQSEGYVHRKSGFLDLLGVFALGISFEYKKEEKNLKIHSLIEKEGKREARKLYLWLAIGLTVISFIGIYFSYKSISQLDYLSKANGAFQRVFVFFLAFTFSLWNRRKELKRRNKKNGMEK